MKTWKEFLNEKSDGKKSYQELTRDYYLYMQQEEVPILPDYGFLLSFYNYIKSGGSLDTTIQPFDGYLLQENFDYLLQEDGSKIYL